MVDQWKAFTPYFQQEITQRFSPSQNSNTPQAMFELVQNLISDFFNKVVQ